MRAAGHRSAGQVNAILRGRVAGQVVVRGWFAHAKRSHNAHLRIASGKVLRVYANICAGTPALGDDIPPAAAACESDEQQQHSDAESVEVLEHPQQGEANADRDDEQVRLLQLLHNNSC